MSGEGWICPKCGLAHGPHIDTCPVRVTERKLDYWSPSLVQDYCACKPGDVCANAACPRRTIITCGGPAQIGGGMQ